MADLPNRNTRPPATNSPNRRPPSGRQPQRATSRPASSDSGDEGEPESAPQRRQRTPAAPQGIPKIYIGAGVAVVLLLVVVIGWSPFTRYLQTSALDGASTLDARKQAAQSLYDRRDGTAYRIFVTRLNSKDNLTRDASAYGLTLIAKDFGNSALPATEELAGAVKGLDESGKISFAPLLGQIAEKAGEKVAAKKDGFEEFQKYLDAIGKGLIPDAAHPAAIVRAPVIEALGKVRASGVCAALINAASNDSDANIRAKAIEGLPATAMPEAAGALLKAVNAPDKELSKTARNAFVRIRDEAKSAELLPVLSDTNDAVRLEIVAALGRRKGDFKAAEGMATALKDKSAEVRKLAVKSIPTTGVSGSSLQILPLISDADENVRIAAAETLGELRDPDAHKALLQGFATSPEGKLLDTMIASLQKHGMVKDIPSISVVMEQIAKKPESFNGLSAALIALSNAQQGPKRDAERKQWTLERWNKWWANLSARDKLKQEAMAKLEKADSRKQETKKVYPELLKMTVAGLDLLDKCVEMCKPDDMEDVPEFDRLLFLYQRNKDLFFKHQELERGK